MNPPYSRHSLILLSALFATGCCTPLPVVPKAIRCEPSAELMARKCAEPAQIPKGATYGTLVDTMLADRKALSECVLTADELRESIEKCNLATDDFNKKIDKLNQSNNKH